MNISSYIFIYISRAPYGGGSWCTWLGSSSQVHAQLRNVNTYLYTYTNQHIYSKYIHIHMYTRRSCAA